MCNGHIRLAAFEAGQPYTHVETPLRRHRAIQRLGNIFGEVKRQIARLQSTSTSTTIFSLRQLGYAFGLFHRYFLGWWGIECGDVELNTPRKEVVGRLA